MPSPDSQQKAKRKVIGGGLPILDYFLFDAKGSKVWVSKAGLREWWRHAYWTLRRWDSFVLVSTALFVGFMFTFASALVFKVIVEESSPWRWLLIPILMLLPIWIISAFRRYMAREIVESWFLDRRCVHCRYDLSRLDRDADGCTFCPECGAAWKLKAPLSERVSE